MKAKKFAVILIASFVLIIISGCGFGGKKTPQDENIPQDENLNGGGNFFDGSDSFVFDPDDTPATLAVYCSGDGRLREAAEKFSVFFPKTEIIFVDEQDDGGLTPDIFFAADIISLREIKSGHRYADFNILMKDDPVINFDDFYLDALRVFETDGALYFFPARIGIDFVSANKNAPENFLEDFLPRKTVSVFDIADMYDAHQLNNLPDGGRFEGEKGFTLSGEYPMFHAMASFINEKEGTCGFGGADFVDFLKKAEAASRGGYMWKSTDGNYNAEAYEAGLAGNAFNMIGICPLLPYYFASYTGASPVFFAAKPLANRRGEILVEGRNVFAINEASENKTLAWKFIKFMMQPEANEFHRWYVDGIPVYKPLLVHEADSNTTAWISSSVRRYNLGDTEDRQKLLMLEQLKSFFDMPMSLRDNYPHPEIYPALAEILDEFSWRSITAEEAAIKMQAKAESFLIKAADE
ncbi:MAG: hypothetical protein FWE82_00740 [Defluviitaleaceae bacterium]|nr:hypothetical protein [Defluviitaleaceae bacterium]